MQDEFLRLQRMLKKTIVFITHDIAEAFRLADRLAIMREGEVDPDRPARPTSCSIPPTTMSREFTEDMPLLRVITVRDLMADGAARWQPAARRFPPRRRWRP